ncbi:hypothetical protein RIF25_04045 [Thermosynechococcaceae cyanobacterium BACA0444]|uniref:Uncharacterized protein n=1 Tax=Pseudocalidococcus azoricus BACA0444 TaxID=2918990 RepID=A0AAE4FS67_9CYAN|nr:hypothetical protein [Pseudocalidococcus azoricus]MDS3859975.1 hypothetical protein [Pseudocalidococcus azoricus BACA0444]
MRIKGSDPFILGWGVEELMGLLQAQIRQALLATGRSPETPMDLIKVGT